MCGRITCNHVVRAKLNHRTSSGSERSFQSEAEMASLQGIYAASVLDRITIPMESGASAFASMASPILAICGHVSQH